MTINKFLSKLSGRAALRGVIAIVIFIAIWEFGSRSLDLIGWRMPFVGLIPPPSDVLASWTGLFMEPSYWQSWYMSFLRVFTGFIVAMIVGIPLGLYMAINRTFYGIAFPSFEILRPIPPLAWVPASIYFGLRKKCRLPLSPFLVLSIP